MYLEDVEWAKIELLKFPIDSGLSSDTTSSPIFLTSVGQWLSSLCLADYESLFVNYGFDDLEFIVSILIIALSKQKENQESILFRFVRTEF